MARFDGKKSFRNVFWISWLCITTPSALMMAFVGFAFSTYRKPSSLSDLADLGGFFIIGLIFSQLWSLPVAAIIGGIWALSVRGLATRATDGSLCSKCGYDLRGCESARCSECGEPFKIASPPHGGFEFDSSKVWRPILILILSLIGIVAFWRVVIWV